MSMTFHPAPVAIAALMTLSSGAWATEYGTVLSSTPVITSVPVVQRQCVEEQVLYPQPRSGAGALLGAIAGAAVGNQIGGGSGRAVATGIGLVLGSQIGDRVEAGNADPVASTVQRCRNVSTYEQRTVGYDVVYEYLGQRRSARLAQDPGAYIALDVSVSPAGRSAPPQSSLPPAMYSDEYQPPPRAAYDPGPQVVVNPWPAIAIGAVLGATYYGATRSRDYRDNSGWRGRGHGR